MFNRCLSTLCPVWTRDRNVTPFSLRWAWAWLMSGLAQARHLNRLAMSPVDGNWAWLEGVAPSTPGDGPRTTAPDRLGGRDAQPAPTERRPPPQRKPDFFHSMEFLPVPFVDGDGARMEGVAPSTPGDGSSTTAPGRLGGRDAQPAPTERRPPPQRNGDFIHGTGFLSVLRLAWTCLVLVGLPSVVPAETMWRSAVTGQELRLESFEPIPQAPAGTRVPLVLYLLHLAAPRNGTVADATLIAELRAQGLRVVTVDFQGHAQARVPFLNRDLYGLRSAVQAGTLGGPQVDQARVYLVPSGHRLTRDLVYAREAGRTRAFDLITPAAPRRAPGVVLGVFLRQREPDGKRVPAGLLRHAARRRSGGRLGRGHGGPPGRRALQGNRRDAGLRACGRKPRCARCGKEAVARGVQRPDRARGFLARQWHGPAARDHRGPGRSSRATAKRRTVDSSVQGAVVLSGRFTYLDLLPTDPMIPRYEKAWGTAAQQPDAWRRHGALDYATQALGVPLFLSINLAESPEALHQMSVLRRSLTAWNSSFVFQPESDGRGHKVPLDPAVLTSLFRFLSDQLHPGAFPDGATSAAPAVARPSSL
jgi:hypothetical protein